MALSSKVTFARSGTTITVNGPSPGTDQALQPMFVTERSANHTRWVYQTTDTKMRVWTLNLNSLTLAQKNALEDFYTNTAKGPTNTFTYTHTDGNSYTCRFVDPMLPPFTRAAPGTFDIQLRLETTAQLS